MDGQRIYPPYIDLERTMSVYILELMDPPTDLLLLCFVVVVAPHFLLACHVQNVERGHICLYLSIYIYVAPATPIILYLHPLHDDIIYKLYYCFTMMMM